MERGSGREGDAMSRIERIACIKAQYEGRNGKSEHLVHAHAVRLHILMLFDSSTVLK